MIQNKHYIMNICAAGSVLLWSLANVLTRYAVTYYSPGGMAFLRFFVAAITLLIYAKISKMKLPEKRDIPLFFLGGAMGFAGHVCAFNIGALTATASVIAFIMNSTPVVTALLAEILLKERLGKMGWLATTCAFGGVVVIAFSGSDFSVNPGIVWICIAALLLSGYNIFQRKLLLRYSALEVTTYCITSAAILLSIFAPKAVGELIHAPIGQIVTLLLLGIFCAALAYVLWAIALSHAEKTGNVTGYMFLIPIISIILGYFMLGEMPVMWDFIGGAIIIAGAGILAFKKPVESR